MLTKQQLYRQMVSFIGIAEAVFRITAVRRITSSSDIDGSRLSSRLDDDELAARAAPFSPTSPLPEIRTRPRQQLLLARRDAAVWPDQHPTLF